MYLKSLHAAEWGNFMERLGVTTETAAWVAATDAQGNAISGEMEVRRDMRGAVSSSGLLAGMYYAFPTQLMLVTSLL